LKSS